MRRLWTNVTGAAVLVGATTLITSHVVSQDAPYGQMPPEAQQAMARMEAWMKYGQPGPEHADLAKAAGTWHNTSSMWMYPGADAMPSESVSRVRALMGNRFVVEEMTGISEMMGEKFIMEGMGIYGYDNYREKHFFIWFDSFSTMPMWGEGEADANGDIVYYSKLPDPTSGATIEYKSIARHNSDDQGSFEMYEKQADGSWFKHMQMSAKRQ